ncbi:hypothetical protein [Undibacterium oligocarboniphilum]|uniref:Secreted protein n=1 Tax=Undibacterium oligocarboniphilum TaxID=666702 RepID=A0A850QN25_9BURK|nr:hypothetical protein [Undibacterium oligocarboniphilum]MBC3869860.1 hypothetical protein [Undibacterium oligocarboniphilum]NVO77476.1 hypothetical protein [Undibacterium oligocarboniphilum]
MKSLFRYSLCLGVTAAVFLSGYLAGQSATVTTSACQPPAAGSFANDTTDSPANADTSFVPENHPHSPLLL